MTIVTSRNQRRILEKENAALPLTLQEVPRSEWPAHRTHILRVFRSRHFLVQEYPAPTPAKVRLSVCRTSIGDNGRWVDGISWDELQQIKRECGYGNAEAVEVFPADDDVVNVANMRHLWVMSEPLQFSWRKAWPTANGNCTPHCQRCWPRSIPGASRVIRPSGLWQLMRN